jgi:hypothetical protein
MQFLSPLKGKNASEDYPLLFLQESVLFPHIIAPVYAGIVALESALKRTII